MIHLTIKEQKSVLDGIVCLEYVNKKLLIKLINSNVLKERFDNKTCEIYQNEKHLLQAYFCKGITEGDFFKNSCIV